MRSRNITSGSAKALTVQQSDNALATALEASVGGGGEVTVSQLWRTLQRRKTTVVVSTVLFFILGIGAAFLITPKYEAKSTIEVNKEASDVVGSQMANVMSDGGVSDSLDYNLTLQTHANVLQSESLAYQVTSQLGLEKRPEFQLTPNFFNADDVKLAYSRTLEQSPLRRRLISKIFKKNLKVKPVAGTRMIDISFLNPDPQVAANIVNTLVSDYLEQYFKTRYSATAQASEWLSKQLSDLKADVEQSQQKLLQYQRQAGILGTDETDNVTMTRLEELNRQVTAAEAHRILTQTIYELVKANSPELVSSAAAATLLTGPSGSANSNALSLIQSLRAQQAQLKSQYAQASTKYGSAFPKLAEMRNQVEDLEASIQLELQKVSSRAANDFRAAKQSEDLLRASFQRQKAEAEKLTNAATQYTLQKHEVEASRKLYDDLLSKLKEAGVLAGLKSTNIVVVDPARTSDRPATPKLPIFGALGLAAGLIFGACLGFIKECMDTTVRTAEQVEAITGLPSLGLVPVVQSAKTGRRWLGLPKSAPADLCMISNTSSQIAEAFRSVRTSVLLGNSERAPQVIMVTSALPQEGKSTASVNTAITLAQQGSKVLLIDADFRRPQVEQRLNVTSTAGLSMLISHGCAPTKYVKHPMVPNLSVLTSGPRPSLPAELLGSPRMKKLIQFFRNEFDYIVIDTPPVLSVTDPIVISKYADATILVACYQQTRIQSLVRAKDMLDRAKANVSGVLFNKVDMTSPDYFYSYGYSPSKYAQEYYHA